MRAGKNLPPPLIAGVDASEIWFLQVRATSGGPFSYKLNVTLR